MDAGRSRREQEHVQKPSFCVSETHPWRALEARHYSLTNDSLALNSPLESWTLAPAGGRGHRAILGRRSQCAGASCLFCSYTGSISLQTSCPNLLCNLLHLCSSCLEQTCLQGVGVHRAPTPADLAHISRTTPAGLSPIAGQVDSGRVH